MGQLFLASDFDGTFRREEEAFARDCAAVRRFRAAGHLFAIATGRCWNASQWLMQTVQCDVIIGCTGALIIDGNFAVCSATPHDSTILPAVADFTMTRGSLYFHVNCGKEEYTLQSTHTQTPPGRMVSFGELAKLPPFEQVNARFETEAEAAAFCAACADAFPRDLAPAQNGNAVDIPPYGVSKVTGIQTAAQMFGVPHACIRTVGDNYNDIPMLRAFCSDAVENGVDAAKAAAGSTVPSVEALIDRLLCE